MGDFLFLKNSIILIPIDFYTNIKGRRANKMLFIQDEEIAKIYRIEWYKRF